VRTYKGYFKAKHPEKYKGNPTNIVYRSSWEFRFMMQLDHNPDVVWWTSEETVVIYNNPTKAPGNHSRYFPDFVVHYNDNRTVMYEIKPYKETMMPVNNGKGKRFLRECITFGINQAKWQAATHYCKSRGWEFKILTENELGLKAR
jgi:hypothetical protein